MADSLTTVYHPTIPAVSRDVEDAGPWVDQGWLKSEPDNAAVKATLAAQAKAKKAADKANATAESVTPAVTEFPAVDPNVHAADEAQPDSE